MMAVHQENIALTDSREVWTPELQLKELTKKLEIMRSYNMDLEVDFKAESDNVILAIPPRNGATWLLHICHQIRMQGAEPTFEEQAEVITWIEGTKKIFDIDPAAKLQPTKPHIFLSHLPYPLVPPGGRRIFWF